MDEQSRRAFTRERLLKILRGEVPGVIQGVRSLGTRRGLKGEKLKTLRQMANMWLDTMNIFVEAIPLLRT